MLQESIQTFDLELWLQEHGAEGQGTEWMLRCPSCGKQKLAVNTRRRLWHCWTCEQYVTTPEGKRRAVRGAGGLVKLVQLVEGLDRAQAIAKIQAGSIYSHRDVSRLPDDGLRSKYLGAVKNAETVPPPDGWRAIESVLPFMAERQITLQDVRQFGLGWCDRGRFAGRLIFPVWEEGRLVYYQGRAMWSPQPGRSYLKSLNPPGGEGRAVSSELLMNLDQAKFYPRVALVEGPTDLVRTGPDAVCCFGKRVTDSQIGRLLRAGVRAIDLMFDAGTLAEMRGVAARLNVIFDLRVVTLPYGDPGDFPRSYLAQARMQAPSFSEMSGLKEL